MEIPRVQYATANDGVCIALSTFGNGQALVDMPSLGPWSHMQLEWQMPQIRRWYERLAARWQVTRYDWRGCGLSDRDVTDFSLEAAVLDLEAVVDRAGVERFILRAGHISGPVAIAYAVRHPERVSQLILWCTYARGADFYRSPQIQGLRGLRRTDWGIYTETVSHAFLGWSEGEEARRFAELIREAVTPHAAEGIWLGVADFDVARLLPEVTVPTLVLHRRGLEWLSMDIARTLAARIPNSRLVVLEGTSLAPYLGDMDSVVTAMENFTKAAVAAPGDKQEAVPAHVRTVLFTDLVGHTEMMSRLGDDRGRAVLREHERITREVLKANGGTEVKTMGDGFMASFGSVTKAVECAVALQRAFAERAVGAQGLAPLRVRCGLNAGEPIEEDGDLFGATVILASRIAAKADGGEILVADTVRGLCSGKGFLFADRGEFVAKGFEEPVRVYEVRWREEDA